VNAEFDDGGTVSCSTH